MKILPYLALIIAFYAGHHVTKGYYEGRLSELKLKSAKAEQAQAAEIARLSSDYYELHQAANNKPAPVVERVLVRAECPKLPSADNAGMGNGADAARVELDRGTVESVTAVTHQHEKQYQQCAARLAFFQSYFKGQ